MKNLKTGFIFSLILYMTVHAVGKGNDNIVIPQNGEKILLNRNWITRQAAYIMVDGALLSAGNQDFRGWMPATVPGTVLTSLLHNGWIPSPYYGMNNLLIPDIFHTGNDFYTYWFVNQFSLPEVGKDERLWLNFRGINYKAEIFLNGKRISTTTHEGMFIRRTYDITAAAISGVNTLAVLVMPPDFPGEDNGGQAGDGQIGRNNTMQCTPGWDWIQAVRDRNTGIWDEVSLTTTGNIRLIHPQVVSKVPGIRTPGGKQADATLTVNVELENLTDVSQTVTVSYEIEKQQFPVKIQLAPREKRLVNLPSMTVKNPRLWWPNCMGEQELYDMTLTVSDGVSANISDKQTVRFGIRDIFTEKDPATGGRKFYVNGQKLFIRGGNYIASDWMLQLSAERYRTEVRFLADMNLNMVRIWGGAVPERPEFYDACDEFGLLVFQDFSVTGDANGAWNDRTKKDTQARRWEYPDNHVLFIESVIDQVKMLRNHPSLCIWCGGNEWPPAPGIAGVLQNDVLPKYDNRHFALFSTDTTFTRNTIGGVGDGPYGIQEPERFFTFRSTPFNPELGSVGVPEATSLRAFMDEADFNDFPKSGDRRINRVWEYHRYLPYGEHIGRYFQPTTTEEFCSIAQLLNFEQYRALMEGWASNMWNWYTGMLIWKIQNPWTALRGQMYDCFLDVNACYYGTRVGGEPLHVQYNCATRQVEVVNTTVSGKDKCTVRARIYGMDGRVIHTQEQKDVFLSANSSKALFAVEQPAQIQGTYFLRLELTDGSEPLSDNVYWLTTRTKDYSDLQRMAPSQAAVSINMEKKNADYIATVHLKSRDKISFFNRVSVFNKKTGERILPVFYSDNYFTVFPNEQKTISLTFATNLPQEDIVVEVREWNGKQTSTKAGTPVITLSNAEIEVGIAPELGGRVIFLRKPGTEGMLLSDPKICTDPSFLAPEITETPVFYPFNGIILWVGPQSDFWKNQSYHLQLKEKIANWPPDPFGEYGRFELVKQEKDFVEMLGPESPVTGLQLCKTVRITSEGKVELGFTATNHRSQPVDCDLWVNIRVNCHATASVQVNSMDDVRIESASVRTRDALAVSHENGIFSVLPEMPSPDKRTRTGKVFIYPETPEIIANYKGERMTIRFDKVPKEQIHPEQGAVELYSNIADVPDPDTELLELEFHGPYGTVLPGENKSIWCMIELDEFLSL